MQLQNIFLLILIFLFINVSNSKNRHTTIATTTIPITHPYQPQDHIVNPHPFSYILNPGYSICDNNDPSVYILIYVHCDPQHYQRRNIIRETWTSRTLFPNLRLVFMMGETHDKNVMKAVKYEYEIYQDIVQENFLDAYKNLTYKGIMALKWISIYCSKTKFILKVDDDIITNTFTLINHLQHLEKYPPNRQNTIFCLLWDNMKVMRDSKSKWYLSKQEFPLETFPQYCSGSAFILTGDVAAKMYNISLYVPFFWVDDYYITGALASAANIKYGQIGSLYTIADHLAHARFLSSKSYYTIMFGHFSASMNKMLEVWNRILTIQKNKFPTHIQLHSFKWDATIYEKPDILS